MNTSNLSAADEVLNGVVLLILWIPEAIRSQSVLELLLRQSLGSHVASQIVEIGFYTGSESVFSSEVGKIKFKSANTVRSILGHLDQISSSRVDPYELRRGRLRLEKHELWVEGIVLADESHGTAVSSLPEQVSTDVSGDYVPSSSSVVPESTAASPPKAVDQSESLEIALMNFILLFSEGHEKEFGLTPYHVVQIIRGCLLPTSVVMLPTKRRSEKNMSNYRVLVEAPGEALRALFSEFDAAVVELVRTTGAGKNHVEARFRVFVNEAPQFKAVIERRRTDPGEFGEVYAPPLVKESLVFEREWVADVLPEKRQAKPLLVNMRPRTSADPRGMGPPRGNIGPPGERPQNFMESTVGYTTVPKEQKLDDHSSSGRGPNTHEVANKSATLAPRPSNPSAKNSATFQPSLENSVEKRDVQRPQLPPGWKAFFSEEHKREYYVFRFPSTGAEISSWTIPKGNF